MATEVEQPVELGQEEEKVLLTWKSLEKPFRQRGRDFYSTVTVLAILVAVVLFFIEGIMPVLVVAAVVFAMFVSMKTPPNMGEHVITTLGIVTAGQKFVWADLVVFWIDRIHTDDVVHVLTAKRWPTQVVMIAPKEGEKVTLKQIRDTLGKYLPYEVPPPSRVDKTVKWFSEKMPLEA